MPETPSTPAPAQPTNQNSLIIIIIAMLAVIALMLFFSMKQKSTSSYASSVSNDEILSLRQRVQNKEQELKDRGIALPVDTFSINELSSNISRDANTLRENIEQFEVALSDKESALTKSNLDLKASLSLNQSLNNEMSKMRSNLTQIQGQQANVAYLKQQLDTLNKTLIERDSQIQELSDRPSPEVTAQFRTAQNDIMLTNQKLNQTISSLKDQLANSIQLSEVAVIRSENEIMKLELQKLRAANDYDSLYAKSVDQLHPEASILYKELEKLEDLSPQQLKQAYELINIELNNHMVKSVQFKTNSSEVAELDQAQILDTLENSAPDSFFLVVGYASETGDKVNNKLLSAKRSVAISSIVKNARGGNTRAVYLGQTDRFSPQPLDNQICEIWELRK